MRLRAFQEISGHYPDLTAALGTGFSVKCFFVRELFWSLGCQVVFEALLYSAPFPNRDVFRHFMFHTETSCPDEWMAQFRSRGEGCP